MPQFPAQPQQMVFQNSPQEEESSGFDFLGVLNRRKWIVFLGLCTGLGLGTLVHYQSAPIYESVADIRIEPRNPMVMKMTNTDLMLPDMEKIMPTRHDRIIPKEVTIATCFNEEVGLYSLESFDEMGRDETVDYVLDNLIVEMDKEDSYNYTIKFRTTNPLDSQTVLSNIVYTYQDMLEKRYKNESERFVKLLREVKTQFQGEYITVKDKIAKNSAKNDSPIIDQTGRTIHMINIAELNSRLRSAKDLLAQRVSERAMIEEAITYGTEEMEAMVWRLEQSKRMTVDEIDDQTPDEAGLEKIEQSIAEIEVLINSESIRFGSGHDRVKELEQRLEFWKNYKREQEQLLSAEVPATFALSPQVMLERYMLTTDVEIISLKSQIQNDSRELDSALVKAEALANIRDERENLNRELMKIEELLSVTTKKIVEVDPTGQLGEMKQREGFLFVPLKNATFGTCVWPQLPILLGIGGFLGILSGFGLGCLVELADKTFHNPDEVMKQLNLPLIGHVPVISQSKRYMVEDSLIEPVICTYHRPKSQTSEAFRAVRTALFFNTQGKQHSVIQVTSPTPGDGKSTLASNLAVCIAQSGKRVLLVDGDMRRPRQHSTFGIKSSEGFATVLSGQSFWRDVVYEVEEIEGLALMPCGAKPNNPSELSTSPQVKELIEQMREEYDFVIIDTPPILAVTDPSPIAARVDGVVLCLRIKKNVKVSAERSTDVLRNLGANIVGVVVNGVGQQTGYGSQYTYGAYRAGYSYNGYGYGYGYGYGSGKYYDEESKATTQMPRRIESAAPAPQEASNMFDGVEE